MKGLWRQLLFIIILTVINAISAPLNNQTETANPTPHLIDTDAYIDANSVLMFVSNVGAFAYDQNVTLGRQNGLYYPYLGQSKLLNGAETRTLVFSAGLWIAGVEFATGDTLVSVSDFSQDFWPGPMSSGTFIPGADSDPQYRVYKLYSDSMSGNPNQDYLEWPQSQGAPVDQFNNPRLIGDQTLWTVFNDANDAIHNNDASSATGLGVEIQNTVWATHENGTDTLLSSEFLGVAHLGSSEIKIEVGIYDEDLLNGHDYSVITTNDSAFGGVWHLIDNTTGDTVLANQSNFREELITQVDGFQISLFNALGGFESFEVVANGGGIIIPPTGGAMASQGFPSPPLDSTQQLGDGIWAFHTSDNGGTSGGGARGDYDSFLIRTFRFNNHDLIGKYDYEMRFTGSNSSPGINGSYAGRSLQVNNISVWVPFELWRIGINTPIDSADDLRLIPIIYDVGDDTTYNLESWGTSTIGSGGYEHSASDGDDDPYTDWVYWYLPDDTTPGESGYLAAEPEILSGNYYGPLENEIMSRTVLINLDGGTEPAFNQDLPEVGTVFRIRTDKTVAEDTFSFTASPPPVVTYGPDDVSVYSKYKIFNRSNNYYRDVFVSLWFDPDLGYSGDDLAGSDTVDDIIFCYNDGTDEIYGSGPPAFGVKLVQGPIVSSIGGLAHIDSISIPNFKNVRMYSSTRFLGAEDPISVQWTYQYMNGLDAARGGIPYDSGTRHKYPGDPVIGNGVLDANSSDRRMFASYGPFDFAPGDSQQIIFKYAVGQGDSPLSSITALRNNLNYNLPWPHDTCCVGLRGDYNGDSIEGSMLDLDFLVNFIFKSGPPAPCLYEGDLNSDGMSSNVIDLVYLINYLFRAGPSPGSC